MYKRQQQHLGLELEVEQVEEAAGRYLRSPLRRRVEPSPACLLYTSDAADERSSVDLGGRRIIKKKNT